MASTVYTDTSMTVGTFPSPSLLFNPSPGTPLGQSNVAPGVLCDGSSQNNYIVVKRTFSTNTTCPGAGGFTLQYSMALGDGGLNQPFNDVWMADSVFIGLFDSRWVPNGVPNVTSLSSIITTTANGGPYMAIPGVVAVVDVYNNGGYSVRSLRPSARTHGPTCVLMLAPRLGVRTCMQTTARVLRPRLARARGDSSATLQPLPGQPVSRVLYTMWLARFTEI